MRGNSRKMVLLAWVSFLSTLAWTCPLGRQASARADTSGTSGTPERVVAIKADRIDTVTNGVIQNGVILIRGTKISEIGTNVAIPGTAEIIDAGKQTVFPGLVSPVSDIGLSSAQRGGPASHARYRVADVLYPYQHEYQRVLQAGFTTLGLVPRGQGVAGQGAVIRPAGRSREEMLVAESGMIWIEFRADGRMKDVIRKALESAKNKETSDDPDVAAMIRALQGKIPTFVSCARPADTIHLLDLLKERDKMKLVLVLGIESHRIAERLVKEKIPVVIPASIEFELFTLTRINEPDLLARAGVQIACVPESADVEGLEDFRRQMAALVKCGLDGQTARKAMTIYPAEALGLDYRLGSLEKGKDANLLVLDGDVLDATTTIQKVMIEGKIVYENPWEKSQ